MNERGDETGSTAAELHALTGAFAAGALDGTERETFAEHLAGCTACEIEVRELVETAALLGVAASGAAPPQLRAAVLTEIARTRQLPPVVASRPDRARRRSRSPMHRWGAAVAAGLALFSIGMGAYAGRLQHENNRLRHNTDQILALETARDARSANGAGGGGTAMVTLSRQLNQMEFVSRNLPDLRAGRTYQIWLIGAEGPRSAGTFTPEHGRQAAKFFRGLGDATTLAVTDEPSGGSAQPTTKPVLSMALPTA